MPKWDSTSYTVGVTPRGYVSSTYATLPVDLYFKWAIVISTSYGGNPDHLIVTQGASVEHVIVLSTTVPYLTCRSSEG
jgi:hypothetical protein